MAVTAPIDSPAHGNDHVPRRLYYIAWYIMSPLIYESISHKGITFFRFWWQLSRIFLLHT